VGTRTRYTNKLHPLGKTAVLTFRAPVSVIELLDAEVAKGKPGIDNRTDALQDALVCWIAGEEDADLQADS
jgi:hypothetical protein